MTAPDELVHPRRGQLHHQLAADEHREDLPAVAQRAAAEPAAARRGRHAVHSGELVDQVIEAILKSAKTGKVGDGKIFITDIDRVIRIRTGETDDAAL